MYKRIAVNFKNWYDPYGSVANVYFKHKCHAEHLRVRGRLFGQTTVSEDLLCQNCRLKTYWRKHQPDQT